MIKDSIKLEILLEHWWLYKFLNNSNNFEKIFVWKKPWNKNKSEKSINDWYLLEFLCWMNEKFLYFCRIKIAGWYKNEENFIFWKYYDVSKWRGIRGKKCSIKRFRESSRMLSLAVSTILINQTNWQLPIIRLRVFHDLSNFIILNSFANFHFFTLFKKFFYRLRFFETIAI